MCERVIVDRQRRTGKVSGSLHGRILQIALLHIFVRILVLPLHIFVRILVLPQTWFVKQFVPMRE